MERHKIDFSRIPMPEALSYFALLFDIPSHGLGWNTVENRIEFVSIPEGSKINEKMAEYIENKVPGLVPDFQELAKKRALLSLKEPEKSNA